MEAQGGEGAEHASTNSKAIKESGSEGHDSLISGQPPFVIEASGSRAPRG